MKSVKYLLFFALCFQVLVSAPAKNSQVTMFVTANVRGQLDPCG